MLNDSVVLYTQSTCPDSPKVRSWLTGHGIPFTERNLTDDPDAASDLAATGTFATPLLVVGGRNLLGYQPAALAALFERE